MTVQDAFLIQGILFAPAIVVTPLVRLSLVLSAIVLALLAWAKWDSSRGTTAEGASAGAAETAEPVDVEAFLSFAAGTADDIPPVGLHHGYTAEGLRRLSAALDALTASRRPTGFDATISNLRGDADRLQQDADSLDHADVVRQAFLAAADLIGAATGADPQPLREAAMAVNPDVPLLDQEERVRAYFRDAAQAMRGSA